MNKELTARSACLQILNNFSDDRSVRFSIADSLDARGKAQVREYTQGIFRKLSYLDFLISEYSSVKIGEMKKSLHNLLRLALYDLLFMDSTPDYAAINEAVNLAKFTISHKTGDLVNAIMRNIQRDIENLPKPAFKDRTKLVATTFSHPEWLVKRWSKRLGEREAFKLMQSNNQRPHFYIRTNNLRTKTEYFKLRMQKHDIPFEESDLLPGYFKVDSVQPFLEKEWVQKGFCQIQDVAAGFAPTILDPQKGENVYDLCAAPGTKSIMIADKMECEGSVLAVDSDTERLEKLAQSALCYDADIIKIRRGDVLDVRLPLADAVLLDAPCTGTGVLSKRADLRWRRTPEDLANIVERQANLLDAAANMVSKHGRLVYSTCSLEPEENMEQIYNFLDEYDNFELQNLEDYLDEDLLIEDGKAYQSYPHKHGCDGHFGVLLKRLK